MGPLVLPAQPCSWGGSAAMREQHFRQVAAINRLVHAALDAARASAEEPRGKIDFYFRCTDTRDCKRRFAACDGKPASRSTTAKSGPKKGANHHL